MKEEPHGMKTYISKKSKIQRDSLFVSQLLSRVLIVELSRVLTTNLHEGSDCISFSLVLLINWQLSVYILLFQCQTTTLVLNFAFPHLETFDLV